FPGLLNRHIAITDIAQHTLRFSIQGFAPTPTTVGEIPEDCPALGRPAFLRTEVRIFSGRVNRTRCRIKNASNFLGCHKISGMLRILLPQPHTPSFASFRTGSTESGDFTDPIRCDVVLGRCEPLCVFHYRCTAPVIPRTS